MDLTRRLAQGDCPRSSAAALDVDIAMRTLGLYRLAEAQLAALPASLQAVADAYCAGVNAFLGTAGVMPPELALLRYRPAPWRPADTLIWGRLMAWQLSGNRRDEVLRQQIARTLTPDQLALLWPALPGEPENAGLAAPLPGRQAALPADSPRFSSPGRSNNWVVASGLFASGEAAAFSTTPISACRRRRNGIWYASRCRA